MHLRHPLGDTTNFKVRMSNLIARNLATFLRLLAEADRLFYVVLEQPKSSWLWHLEWIVAIGLTLKCVRIHTWILVFANLFFSIVLRIWRAKTVLYGFL